MSGPDDLLTPAELAARWDFKVATLATWRFKKKGPPYVKINTGGKRLSVRYRLADVRACETEGKKP